MPGPPAGPPPDASSWAVDADDEGLVLRGGPQAADLPLDVCFDGRRIWSFWSLRDTRPGAADAGPGVTERRAPWPHRLRSFLDGTTDLSVVAHVDGTVLLQREQRFGTAEDRIAVVNAEGKPLGIDNSGRLALTFDSRSASEVAPLLDAVEEVLAALRAAGVEAFAAYGTLLGAVREGRLIGHDSDADLGYVSHHTDPADACRESFLLQRRLQERGYRIQRYSGVAFRIDVVEGDGSVRGLDVFGGFLDSDDGGATGTLYLMGEVGAPFRREWLHPLGTATFEDRTVPVPAEPGRLLEAMYGPGWQVPDPAFRFTTPEWVHRALNGWFRGTRVHRNDYARTYAPTRRTPPPDEPSALATWLLEQEGGEPGRVVDLGAGRGADALHLARQGLEVTAYDYMPWGMQAAAALAADEGLRLESAELNLLEHRSALAIGAREAHRPGPRTLLARHLADATTAFGRHSLWRISSMALRRGGRLYLEHWADGVPPGFHGQHRMPTADLVEEMQAFGLEVVHHEQVRQPAGEGGTRTVGRVVAQWRGPHQRGAVDDDPGGRAP